MGSTRKRGSRKTRGPQNSSSFQRPLFWSRGGMDSIAVETHFPRCYEKHVTNFSNQRFTDLMGIRVILGGLLRENRTIEGRERSFGSCRMLVGEYIEVEINFLIWFIFAPSLSWLRVSFEKREDYGFISHYVENFMRISWIFTSLLCDLLKNDWVQE